MVYSASSAISTEYSNTPYYYLKRQSVFLGVALLVMVVTASFPYKLYKPYAYIILITSFFLLIGTMVPILSVRVGGADRWIKIGGISFQPAEFAKLAFIIFMGASLSKKRERIKQFSIGYLPHCIIFGFFAYLMMIQPDSVTVIVMGITCMSMMFISGVRVIHLLAPLPSIIPIVYFLIFKVSYRQARIMAFLDPWEDPLGIGYQLKQSLIAIGSGGLSGKGLGLGMQKMYYLPEPHTDFILSVIGEELGFIGILAILTLYSIILISGIQIAKNSDSFFGAIVAAGITIHLGIQTIINTGVVLGLLPMIGLPLPFISYGGTSLIINMAAMGILINIGKSINHNMNRVYPYCKNNETHYTRSE